MSSCHNFARPFLKGIRSSFQPRISVCRPAQVWKLHEHPCFFTEAEDFTISLSSQVFWLHKLSNIVTSWPSILPPDSNDLLTIATDHCRSSPLITTPVFSPIMGTTSTLSQKAQCTPGFYHPHTIIPSHVIVSSSLTASSTVNPALQKTLLSFSKMSLYSLVHSVLP